MSMNKWLAGVAAVAMMTGAALASDRNKAFIDQDGANNSASIEQGTGGGAGNQVGSSTSPHRVLQDGDNNVLVIEQVGQGNFIAGNLGNNNADVGLDQLGDGNTATLIQNTKQNKINQVQQDSTGSTGGTNVLNVQQGENPAPGSTDRNRVSNVAQTATGADDNDADINQFGRYNLVGTGGENSSSDGLIQAGSGNSATLTQDGRGNAVARAEQDGIDNVLTISQTGDDNGTTGFTAGGFADIGVAQGNALQIGDGNTIDYAIANNNNNSFGFEQSGDGNTITGTSIFGDDNQLAALQTGDGNTVTFEHTGTGNVIGVVQTGNGNIASPIVTGEDNLLGVNQIGADNAFGLTITGDRNGGAGSFGSNAAGDIGLTAGLFEQLGNDNTFSGSVVGNDNVLASFQNGNDNDISGMVTGSSNQIAVSQVGNNNIADFTTNGSSNVVGISQ